MTTAEGLVTALRSKGVELVVAGDRLRFRPPEGVTVEELDALRQHKAEVLRLLARPDLDAGAVLAMSLLEFEARGALLEIRVPWLSETLWLVPAERDVRALLAEVRIPVIVITQIARS